MSTSIFGYPVVTGTDLYGASTDPTDTTILRDTIANGLLHYADEYAQVRVCAAFPGSAVTFNGATNATVDASPTAAQWYLLAGGCLGPWPLTQHMDGRGYALRIRLRGCTSNVAGEVIFRVVLAPLGRALEYRDQTVDFVWTSVATTSTSPSWLTGTTSNTGLQNRLVVDAATALSWVRSGISAPEDAVTPRSISQCLVALHVYAKTTNSAGLPQMFGCYAAEYVGI